MATQDGADGPQEVTEDCIFCRIAQGDDENTVPLYQDDEIVIFHDIRPSSTNHFLVCTTQHIRDASRLNKSHIPLVERMIAISKRLLEERGADFSQARLGIHWPPFISVSHFHVHVICPEAQIPFYTWAIGKFNQSTYWFRSVDWLLEKLKNMPEESSSDDTPQGSSTEMPKSQKASQMTGADTSDDSSHYETGRESSNEKTLGTSQEASQIAGQDTSEDTLHDAVSHDADLVQETVHRTEDNGT